MSNSTLYFVLAGALGFGSAAWAGLALDDDKAGIALFLAACFLVSLVAGIAEAIKERRP